MKNFLGGQIGVHRYIQENAIFLNYSITTAFCRTGNRPFPSSLALLFQNESTCETFLWKWVLHAVSFFMQIKVISVRLVSHLDSLWNGGARELRNGLLSSRSHLWISIHIKRDLQIKMLNWNKVLFKFLFVMVKCFIEIRTFRDLWSPRYTPF